MDRVAFCIPVYGTQEPTFWRALAGQMAAMHKYDIEIVGPDGSMEPFVAGSMMTDRNRNSIVRKVFETTAEWTYWHDADNVNPEATLPELLKTAKAADRTIMCAVYFGKGQEHRPIAYLKLPDGRYSQIENYNRGEIIPIDAAGMNAALIHRSVFEDIDTQYVALQKLQGGIVAVHRDDIVGDIFDTAADEKDDKVVDGVLRHRMMMPSEPTDVPFFRLEFSRTEDMVFFEMAKRCGHDAYLDTRIECGHLASLNINGKVFRKRWIRNFLGLGGKS